MTHGHSGVHPFQQLWLEIICKIISKSLMLYSLKPHHHNHNHKKDDHCFEFLNLRQECRQSCSVPGPPQLIQPPESILAIFCIFCAFFAIKKATIPWHRSFQSAWCNHWGCKGGSQSSNLLKILLQNLCFRDLKFCLIFHFLLQIFDRSFYLWPHDPGLWCRDRQHPDVWIFRKKYLFILNI